MTKISVIVPVYNVGKYIKKCLDSLVNQTFKDIEIICVDDGSTDNSMDVVREFAKKYSMIKIFTQNNSGVSAARNSGICHAQSDYIMFLDGDDYFRKNACEIAFNTITSGNFDIGIFGITEKYWFFEKPCIMNKNVFRAAKNPEKADLWKFQTYSVNKIYKKSFLTKNSISFPQEIKTSEDLIFSLCCLFNASKCCFCANSLYVYRKNSQNSATKNSRVVKNDLTALKYFYETEIFQKQSLEFQLKVIEKFCSGSWHYYKFNRFNSVLKSDIKALVNYINSKYSETDLSKFKMYNRIKSIK